MKSRTDFVSNSSSSSFIVNISVSTSEYLDNKQKLKTVIDSISDSGYDYTENGQIKLLPSDDIGEISFGWENKEYRSIGDKLNFCAIQCRERYPTQNDIIVEETEWWKMLTNEIYSVIGNNSNIVFKFNYSLYDSFNAYIDHQSSAGEGQNIEMFEQNNILDFLISKSYIQGGNDNDY